jgi:hypothetical protein
MFLAAAFTVLVSGAPDRWGRAEPAVYVSERHKTSLEVVPVEDHGTLRARGTVVSLGLDGARHVLWSKQLQCMPLFALVTDSGRAVTFDQHGGAGAEHALVVYGVDGALVKDWSLKQLLTKEEYYETPATVSSRWWWKPSPPNDVPRIAPADATSTLRVVIPTISGDALSTVEVDLATGKRLH